MFTVKLMRGHTIKILQAEQVDIYPAGPATGIADEPKDRTTEVLEVVLKNGDATQMFPIYDTGKPRPASWHDTVEFFDMAYIENERGATTQVVKPY